MEITTIGLDLAKSIFQVHAVDAAGSVVACKALRRSQVLPFFTKLSPCLVGIEACGTSHHWARELAKLGHEVRRCWRYLCLKGFRSPSNGAAWADALSGLPRDESVAAIPSDTLFGVTPIGGLIIRWR